MQNYGYNYGYNYEYGQYYKSEQRQPEEKPYIATDYVEKMKVIVKSYTKPMGTREFPAKTCRDLQMNYPDVADGQYFIDPNRGSTTDAFLADCRFTDAVSETCVPPAMEAFTKRKWMKTQRDGFRWYVEEINAEIGKIEYPSSRSQFAFLRMEHQHAEQNMTYNCRNSHAHRDSDNGIGTYVKVMTNDDVEVSTSSRSRYNFKVVSDGCSVKDGEWHKTLFNMRPRDLDHLPIIDVGVYDVDNEKEEFELDVGPVCFH
jgi:hypothetical protein